MNAGMRGPVGIDFMILLHGTTRRRAESIMQNGPDPRFREPGGLATNDGFSTCVEGGPTPFGVPSDYAKGKAMQFPNEGGAAILTVDVPSDVIAFAVNEWFPLSQGLVQFDVGNGLEELLSAWPFLVKEIRDVT